MWIAFISWRAGSSGLVAYTLFVLWMAAGLLAVIALTMIVHGGLRLATRGDRPLEQWPLLRKVLRHPS